MNTDSINRREFVAIGAATAAAVAVSSNAMTTPALGTNTLNIPAPSLAKIIPSVTNPSIARLTPQTHAGASIPHLANPMLTLTPLPCVDGRLDTDAAITIELFHPTPKLYSILYSAHNISIPNKSIPTFGSSIKTKAPVATTTIRITQRIAGSSQAERITFNTNATGTYLLAIPTATRSSKANFRFTAVHLDHAHQITKLTNPMPAASSRCAYFSITISDTSTGE